MLRKSFINKIEAILEATPLLLASDFKIDSGSSEKGRGVFVRINYTFGDGEYFQGQVPEQAPSSTYPIGITCTPGEFATGQAYIATNFSDFFGHIQSWANRISEELRLAPVGRQIEEQRSIVKFLEDRLSGMEDRAATVEEVERLRNWMNEVEANLKERIEHLEIKDQEKDKQIEELSIEFEVFRARASKMSVKKIFQAVFTRIYKIGADPNFPQLIENGVKIIKMLPPS